MTFSNNDAVDMAKIIYPRGTDHDWDHSEREEWTWQEMVAHLGDGSMQVVVQGPDNRSRGIVKCQIRAGMITRRTMQ